MRDYTWLDMMKIMQEIRLFFYTSRKTCQKGRNHIRSGNRSAFQNRTVRSRPDSSGFDCPDGTLQIRSQPSDRPSGKERISSKNTIGRQTNAVMCF